MSDGYDMDQKVPVSIKVKERPAKHGIQPWVMDPGMAAWGKCRQAWFVNLKVQDYYRKRLREKWRNGLKRLP